MSYLVIIPTMEPLSSESTGNCFKFMSLNMSRHFWMLSFSKTVCGLGIMNARKSIILWPSVSKISWYFSSWMLSVDEWKLTLKAVQSSEPCPEPMTSWFSSIDLSVSACCRDETSVSLRMLRLLGEEGSPEVLPVDFLFSVYLSGDVFWLSSSTTSYWSRSCCFLSLSTIESILLSTTISCCLPIIPMH